MRKVSIAFEPQGIMLPLAQLLPLRRLSPSVRGSEKYKCIMASIKEVGLIEPLIVFPQKDTPNQYLLLDGTLRADILNSLGETEAFCLKATDDEAFTYNHKVNQLSPIQEHFMIMKALGNGVSEERIAATLNVDVPAIRRKRDLVTGICPEAVNLLKDRRVSPAALRELKRVVPLRQIEMAELMTAANNCTASYAKCLYAGTPEDQRLPDQEPEEDRGLASEDVARMQREMATLHRDIKVVEESHGENVLNLVLSVGYVRKLLGNSRIERYLRNHHADILAEIEKILEAPELDNAAPA